MQFLQTREAQDDEVGYCCYISSNHDSFVSNLDITQTHTKLMEILAQMALKTFVEI